MTRNEFIAETAARLFVTERYADDDGRRCAVHAVGMANALEACGVAPWLTPPAPALTDAARRVVAAAVNAFEDDDEDEDAARVARVRLWDAVRAYKESDNG